MESDIEYLNSEIRRQLDDNEEEDLLVSQLNMDVTNQYVVFSVDKEEYGLPILSVQEIISLPLLTRIPGVPDYIPGIINLRGNIIPLYALRTKFNMKKQELDENSIIIIVQTENESNRTVGFIVDAVSDVASIGPDDFQKAPEFADTKEYNFIDKIGHLASRMIIIIDMEKFFSESDRQLLGECIKENVAE